MTKQELANATLLDLLVHHDRMVQFLAKQLLSALILVEKIDDAEEIHVCNTRHH